MDIHSEEKEYHRRMNVPQRNHRPDSWSNASSNLLPGTSPYQKRGHVEKQGDLPASRRRSSSSYVMYPCMDDISSSETEIDVEEVFQRASFVSLKGTRFLDDDDDEPIGDRSAIDKEIVLGNLFEQQHKQSSSSSKQKNFDDNYSYAHQSITETTYEESTIFSENMSPTCDSEYALSVTSSSSILSPAATHGRPRCIGSSSAFDVYSPPLSSPKPSVQALHGSTSPSWEESLSCADLMQEPPMQDRYAGATTGTRTSTRAPVAASDRYHDSERMQYASHQRAQPQRRQPYYPSPQQGRPVHQRNYIQDPFLLEKEPSSSPHRRTQYAEGSPNRSSRRYPQEPAESQHRRPQELEIEITPGTSMPLRGSQETIAAVESGYLAQLACLACETFLATVPDCQLVICPACRFLSPVDDGDCFRHGQPAVTSRRSVRRGIGLGLQI